MINEESKYDKWHRVADGDLPKDARYVWTNVGAGYHDDDGWWDDFGRLQNVIAWCEPKFCEYEEIVDKAGQFISEVVKND